MLSDEVVFVVDPSGNRYMENMAIVPNGNDDFDFEGSDWVTNAGNVALQHAIDPSAIGTRVELRFDADYDPEDYIYTPTHYQADLTREASWQEKSYDDLITAIQTVVDGLWSGGVTQFLHHDKPIIYGTSDSDTISGSTTTEGYDLLNPEHGVGIWSLALHLNDFVQNGIVYRAGQGEDWVAGTEHNDVVYGDGENDLLFGKDGSDILFGGQGVDSLFGGGADDFIFFDFADGANVYGGAGRDVGVALGQDGVTVDMAAQGLEWLIGCEGADTITVGEAESGLFAAGGAGNDTFVVTNGDGFIEGGPRILWGGSGADTFEFEWASYAQGIAVVQIDGLTDETFASLTLADLGLGSLNLEMFQAIILNPDQDDRFVYNGDVFSSELQVSGDDRGASVKTHESDFITQALGRPLSVQGLYEDDFVFETTPNFEWDNMENIISVTRFTGVWDSAGNAVTAATDYDPLDEADQAEAMELYEYYQTHTDQVFVHINTYPEYNAFWSSLWVVGGTFSGEALSANGDLTAQPLGDPGATPFDWLLAA